MVLLKVEAAGQSSSRIWDLKGQTNIVEILATHSSCSLKSLHFSFLQEDGNLCSSKIIGSSNLTGGTLNVITFKGEGEYVTEVEGLYQIYNGTIQKLSIHTNVKVYQVFVAEGDLTKCKKFSYKFGGLNQFGGFHGTETVREITTIGVYVNQLQALPPNFKCSSATLKRSIKHEL